MHKIKAKRQRKGERTVLEQKLESLSFWVTKSPTDLLRGHEWLPLQDATICRNQRHTTNLASPAHTRKTEMLQFGGQIFSCRKLFREGENTMQESIAKSNPKPFSFSFFIFFFFYRALSRQYFNVHTPLPSCD